MVIILPEKADSNQKMRQFLNPLNNINALVSDVNDIT